MLSDFVSYNLVCKCNFPYLGSMGNDVLVNLEYWLLHECVNNMQKQQHKMLKIKHQSLQVHKSKYLDWLNYCLRIGWHHVVIMCMKMMNSLYKIIRLFRFLKNNNSSQLYNSWTIKSWKRKKSSLKEVDIFLYIRRFSCDNAVMCGWSILFYT